MAATTSHPDGSPHRVLALAVLLSVLIVAREMPPSRASGLELLPLKVQWSMAWMALRVQSPLTPLAAQLVLQMDPGRRTVSGRRAAGLLARQGSVHDRLRWSAELTRQDRRNLPLLVTAVRAALAGRDCAALRTAVRVASTLTQRDRTRVAREFGRSRFAHWGSVAPRAGLRVANQPELRRTLRRLKDRPPRGAKVMACAIDRR